MNLQVLTAFDENLRLVKPRRSFKFEGALMEGSVHYPLSDLRFVFREFKLFGDESI